MEADVGMCGEGLGRAGSRDMKRPLPIVPETHQQGFLSVENLSIIQEMNNLDCDVGVQLHNDGRIWVCVNGIAFLRFRPER